MPHSYSSCLIHYVFSTKGRKKTIAEELRGRLWAYVGGISGIEETVSYINRQKQHHRTTTFEDEFVAFLKRHGIDYDERYVWG